MRSKRGFGVRMGEISSLIYLIFPIFGLFYSEHQYNILVYSIILSIFTISYLILVLFHTKINKNYLYIFLLIHYLCIMYFVYAYEPLLSMFFFYSAFALPFIFDVGVKSKEFISFITTMIICAFLTYITHHDYVYTMIIYYIVILMIAFGNFQVRKDRRVRKELEEKNKYINVLIAEQERNRIGQDLHDTLGHVFASLTLKSELATKLLDTDKEAARNEMRAINELSRETLNKVRTIIDDLKVQSFEEEVLSVESILHDANLNFIFKNKSAARSLNPAKQSILSMILREAINNVIKHAHATEVVGKIKEKQHEITLIVSDNGVGIDDDDASSLKSIRERTAYLNGEVKVQSNEGTTIIVRIPRSELM
ncbi:sensor histidine kinase [Staphylococcus capitis]|uniref:sensor histidine kinase n=1 Tax=Staphylococcus capitis TaxID=29388 RepID=UPI000D19A3FC|nr:sensor histidine kinase [Staphylococcus capitis]PTG26970.1 sensor histidine kinase [Staphylococcus capitis]PTG31525.1 sensor histidine kinase [Staphylococcus capitis]PTG36147.1 sensor histidine kinase [Staphylococcus capitis]PTH02474.1 sensor histidine kinase [Staphylococcus capitis]PTH06773.1 sensor histidine kinase [Staphylococcus capitis]